MEQSKKTLLVFVKQNDDPSQETISRVYNTVPLDKVEIVIYDGEVETAKMEQYGLGTIPATVLLCEQGTVISTHTSLPEFLDLEQECSPTVEETVLETEEKVEDNATD